MKKLLFAMVSLVAMLAFVSCGPAVTQAKTGQPFSLAIGQRAEIGGQNLSIKLLDVFGDSRCPKGVQCIWAGQVSCLFQVTPTGSAPYEVIIIQGGSSTATQTVQGLEFSFNVTPYPEAGKQISLSEYKLILTVEKLPPSPD